MLKKKAGMTDAQLAEKQTFPIHPGFRIISLDSKNRIATDRK